MEEKLEKIMGRLEECRPELESSADFSLLCMSEGMKRVHADNGLYEELGMSGDELLECFNGVK